MYLDADIIYALLKPADRHLEFAKKTIATKETLYTSTIAFVELELVVKRELNDYLARHITEAVLKKIPKLKIVPFDKKILVVSLKLQQEFGLGIFDSFHAATALSKDKKIASTDHIFERIPKLERIIPEKETETVE